MILPRGVLLKDRALLLKSFAEGRSLAPGDLGSLAADKRHGPIGSRRGEITLFRLYGWLSRAADQPVTSTLPRQRPAP